MGRGIQHAHGIYVRRTSFDLAPHHHRIPKKQNQQSNEPIVERPAVLFGCPLDADGDLDFTLNLGPSFQTVMNQTLFGSSPFEPTFGALEDDVLG